MQDRNFKFSKLDAATMETVKLNRQKRTTTNKKQTNKQTKTIKRGKTRLRIARSKKEA